jgi:glycosyltransferase involved in cell wall biosynthesis
MKILFINHSAARTGAPIMLFHLLKWLKDEKRLRFDVLSLKNGELLEDFTSVCVNHFYRKKNNALIARGSRFIGAKMRASSGEKLFYPESKLKSIAKGQYDLIYSNSVVSIPSGNFIKKHSSKTTKFLVHFHELNIVINQYCPELNKYIPNIDVVIAASKSVKNNLISNWRFTENSINVVYEHSNVQTTKAKSDNEFIVGASGIVDWRKGPDFFLLVARYIFKIRPDANIRFQWVGRISKQNKLIFEQDVKNLNLEGKIEFTGSKTNPHDYFSNFDVFLMTSKEDPFPLVCIEVGMMGIPIVCFKGATGTEEMLYSIEGSIVCYLDIEGMGNSVLRYYDNESLKNNHGQQIKEMFSEFKPENQGPKILKILNDLFDNDLTNIPNL